MKRKRAPGKDLSYRPPGSAKVKAAKTGCLDDSGQPEDGDRVHVDCPAQDHVSDGVQSPNPDQEVTAPPDDTVELQIRKVSDGIEASRDEVLRLLDQHQSLARDVTVLEQENTADDRGASEAAVDKEMEVEAKETGAASASNEAAERRPNVS